MKKKNKNLPTLESSLGGGYLESRKKPRLEKRIITSIVSILILVLIIGISYSYIRKDTKQQSTNVTQTNCINVELEDVTNAIVLKNAYPMEDSKGETTEPYTFKLTNTCNVGVNYNIDLEIIQEENAMSAKNIATKIDENDKVVLLESTKTTVEGEEGDIYKIGSGTLDPHTSVEHSLRLWLDINAGNDAQNKTFKSKIIIDALQNQVAVYSEPILHGADPIIDGDLIPVKINPETGIVTKANMEEEWYSYERREWANAIILTESGKEKNYQNNAEIDEDDIESYFVWIPKYSYKLFDENMGKYTSTTVADETKQNKAIEIEFGIVDTKNDESNENHKECASPNESGVDGHCHVGDWMTHPAFMAFEGSKGFWIGKFETGYKDANSTATAQKNETTTGEGNSKVIIKPNAYSWRNITVKNAFDASYYYKRNLDSHLIKNTEWGAVAYLTQSIYGRCTSSTTCTETIVNSRRDYLTGYDDEQAYPQSIDASITLNNSGVFDMSGGAFEFVAAVMYSSNDKSSYAIGSSQLDTNTLNKIQYFDRYNYNSGNYQHWERRILGDATGELGPFHVSTHNLSAYFNDYANFLAASAPFIGRGGFYTNDSANGGIFSFGIFVGTYDPYVSFRIVLTPTNEVA